MKVKFTKNCFNKRFRNFSTYDINYYNQIKNDAFLHYKNSDYRRLFYQTNLQYLINSMKAIKIKLKNIVFIGKNPDYFIQNLPDFLHPDVLIYCDFNEESLRESKNKIDQLKISYSIIPILINNNSKLPFETEKIHCLISHLNLHSSNDVGNLIKEYGRIIEPDGCVLADFVCEGSFQEISSVFNLAEQEREGGVSLNAHNFHSAQAIGNFLSKENFNLTSFNINKYFNYFDSLTDIFEFLRHNGETNCLQSRRKFKSRDSFISAISLYKHLYSVSLLTGNDNENFKEFDKFIHTVFKDQKIQSNIGINSNNINNKDELKEMIYCLYNICSFIGWKHDPLKQQQPSNRGSAEFNLKDLVEDGLNEENEIKYGAIIKKDKSNKPKLDKKGYTTDEFEMIDLTDKMKEVIKLKRSQPKKK